MNSVLLVVMSDKLYDSNTVKLRSYTLSISEHQARICKYNVYKCQIDVHIYQCNSGKRPNQHLDHPNIVIADEKLFAAVDLSSK